MIRIKRNIFFIVLAILIFILAFLIARPFIEALLTAAVVAYIFHPVYRWLLSRTKRPYLSASLVIIIILLVSIAALSLLIGSLYKQAYSIYNVAKGGFAVEDLKIFNENFSNYIMQLLKDSASFISDQASGFLLSIPKKFISMFVALFTIFFLLIDGEQLLRRIRKILPLKEKQKTILEKDIGSMLYAVVFCTIIVSIIQGIIGLIGFYIFRIDHPIFWALILTLAAMIPFVGAWVVWLPAALIKIISGYYAGNNAEIFLGIGLFIYGALLVSTIDNIIKPKIIGDRARLHPVFVLIGILGGLILFGFVGILIGPVIMTLFVNIIEFYREFIKR